MVTSTSQNSQISGQTLLMRGRMSVYRVTPVRKRQRVSSSRLDDRNSVTNGTISSLILKFGNDDQSVRHAVNKDSATSNLNVAGETGAGWIILYCKERFATESAISFPWIPIWAGIQTR